MDASVIEETRTLHRILLMVCATALATAVMMALPHRAHADRIIVPDVPPAVKVDAGNTPFFVGHGVGTQNYICLPCPNATPSSNPCPASGFAFTLFTPEAVLFRDNDRQVTTHFFSPNPEEGGAIRATWQHSRDTSTVWGVVKKDNSAVVTDGAIPWLKVTVVGAADGPTGGGTLTPTTFIQRVNTSGGVAPSTGCALSTDVGRQSFVPYTADYIFYKHDPSHADEEE